MRIADKGALASILTGEFGGLAAVVEGALGFLLNSLY